MRLAPDRPEQTGTEIPHERLSPDVLRQLVESYVNREGTDYGLHERSLDQKVADVVRQLESGEAVIVFDRENESFDIHPSTAR